MTMRYYLGENDTYKVETGETTPKPRPAPIVVVAGGGGAGAPVRIPVARPVQTAPGTGVRPAQPGTTVQGGFATVKDLLAQQTKKQEEISHFLKVEEDALARYRARLKELAPKYAAEFERIKRTQDAIRYRRPLEVEKLEKGKHITRQEITEIEHHLPQAIRESQERIRVLSKEQSELQYEFSVAVARASRAVKDAGPTFERVRAAGAAYAREKE